VYVLVEIADNADQVLAKVVVVVEDWHVIS
jgi:hypothetical protein